MEDFTIVHHFKKDKETFLRRQAEILGEALAKAVENGDIKITTTDK